MTTNAQLLSMGLRWSRRQVMWSEPIFCDRTFQVSRFQLALHFSGISVLLYRPSSVCVVHGAATCRHLPRRCVQRASASDQLRRDSSTAKNNYMPRTTRICSAGFLYTYTYIHIHICIYMYILVFLLPYSCFLIYPLWCVLPSCLCL